MQVIIIMQDLYFENRISFVVVCPTHVFSIALKGIFPKAAFKYIPYTQPDQLVVDIQDYKIHIAFPVNGAVAQLIQSKGIVISKVFQFQRSRAPPLLRDSFRIAILSARATCFCHARANCLHTLNLADGHCLHRGTVAPLQVF
jgi:hypothetical protein